MIVFLVDTSVWIGHFARSNAALVELLVSEQVLAHPCVVGELALSSMKRRQEILALLRRLPRARVATDDEVMAFIQNLSLHGRGIGWVDAQLLASARLTGCGLWTTDRKLLAAAAHARLATRPSA